MHPPNPFPEELIDYGEQGGSVLTQLRHRIKGTGMFNYSWFYSRASDCLSLLGSEGVSLGHVTAMWLLKDD